MAANESLSAKVSKFLRREQKPAKAPSPSTYHLTSHDSQFFIRRESRDGMSYAGPYSSVPEARALADQLRSGESHWSELTTHDRLPSMGNWPRREGDHRIDVRRQDGAFRVAVERSPQKLVRDGEQHFEPGFRALSNDLYESRSKAKQAATRVLRALRETGQFDESAFEVEDIERAPQRQSMPNAPVHAGEYRQHLATLPDGAEPIQRPFQLRDAMPHREDLFFRPVADEDGRHRVLFDGSTTMSWTQPFDSREAAENLARELNLMQTRGDRIPWQHYGFGDRQPNDRRFFIVELDGNSQVLFNGNFNLGRSQPMSRDAAEALRAELATKMRQGESIDWKAFRMRWGRHPDRLTLQETHGKYRLVYETKDNAVHSDVLFATKGDASQALDSYRRRLFRGEPVDMRAWTSQRTARSLELRVRQGPDERFRVVTGSGRVFHRTFDDFAEAEATKAAMEPKIASGDLVPDAPQWLAASQLSTARLSPTVEAEIDTLLEYLADPDVNEGVLDAAAEAVHRHLSMSLGELTPSQVDILEETLASFGEVKSLNEAVRDIGVQLDAPELQDPITDPGSLAIKRDLLEQRTQLEHQLADLPREGPLAGDIARQLRGRQFDPESLTAAIPNPRHQQYARALLEQYQAVQQEYLPRALALSLASQRAGVEMRAELLGNDASKWAGTIANLSPVQHAGVLGGLRQSVQAARRLMQPEHAAGLAH